MRMLVVTERRSGHFRPDNFSGNLLTCVACPAVSHGLEGTCHFLSVGDITFGKIRRASFAVSVVDDALVQGAEIVS